MAVPIDQERIIDEAKQFAALEIEPYATEFDTSEIIPEDLIGKMAAKGYLAACFPKEYNGLGLDAEYYGRFTEVIGKACCSTRTLLTVHTSLVGQTLLKRGSQTQKDKWLPRLASGVTIAAFALSEPNIGSDAKGVQTQFKRAGRNYIINGRKKWITFGHIADLFLVFATNDDGVSGFLVERQFNGVKTWPIKGLLGSRAAQVAEIEFNDVIVPKENLVGKLNNGFTYVASTALDYGRYSIAWAGVALLRQLLKLWFHIPVSGLSSAKKFAHFN